MCDTFPPTRSVALSRLSTFAPKAGRAYASSRNFDHGPGRHDDVSRLSPYLRTRLITEHEVLSAVLGRHSASAAEKFIQEVFWRSYWKGWLEMRPGIWADYLRDLDRLGESAARTRAEAGATGIAPFDAWAGELRETGYLHNHARMWFASIWIFTLGLPWQQGADFFLRHLLDGDPASNTLGWRWVAGLQTRGKHYLARASNIDTYTDGRFGPITGLREEAEPLSGPEAPPRRPLPDAPVQGARLYAGRRSGLLIHDDDLSFHHGAPRDLPVAGLLSTEGRSPCAVSQNVMGFTHAAMADALNRHGAEQTLFTRPEEVAAWAAEQRLEQVVAPYAPVGPAASRLHSLRRLLQRDGISLITPRRAWDSTCWPHATHGFFRFKKQIPHLLSEAGLC